MSLTGEVRRRRRRIVKKLGKRLVRRASDFLGAQSVVGTEPVLLASDFPELAALQADWKRVREELDGVLADRDRLPPLRELSPDQARIATDDRWRSFPLHGFGYRVARSCERCPETARLVEAIPGMQSAWFSVVGAGCHVPSHRGITRGMLTVHLALRVPEPRERCRIRIADRDHHWREGELLIFDDTVPHAVWNDTDGDRVVLLIDVDRPMRWPGGVFHRLFMAGFRQTGYVKDARANFAAWERSFYSEAGPESVTASTSRYAPSSSSSRASTASGVSSPSDRRS